MTDALYSIAQEIRGNPRTHIPKVPMKNEANHVMNIAYTLNRAYLPITSVSLYSLLTAGRAGRICGSCWRWMKI